jgi:hypothetical protein
MLVEKAAEFVDLTKRRKELQEELTRVEEKLKALSAQLIQAFETSPGVNKISVNGMTVFPRRQVFASPKVDREHAIQVLKDAGYGSFVQPNYNANSVTALVRELERDGKLDESGLKEGFVLTEKFSVSANASGGKANNG